MKKLFVLPLFIILVIYACGNKTKEVPNNSISSKTSGEENYKKNCISCHGSDGNLGVAGAKKLPESILKQDDRIQIITHGKGTMPAFQPPLSDDEIKAIAEFTFTLK